jgi:thioredoxin 2
VGLQPQLAAMIIECTSCVRSNRLPASRLNDKARCAACKAALLPLSRPLTVHSKEEFDELVSAAPVPVVVDFWASWCGPCRVVGPELEKLARERAGSLLVAKVDTEELPALAGQFGIRSLPTMVLMRGGQEAKRVSGAMPADAIASGLAI